MNAGTKGCLTFFIITELGQEVLHCPLSHGKALHIIDSCMTSRGFLPAGLLSFGSKMTA